MAHEWQGQLKEFVNTVDRLKSFINLTPEEEAVLENNQTTWGTTPYFASLMDRDDPDCPIRKQVVYRALDYVEAAPDIRRQTRGRHRRRGRHGALVKHDLALLAVNCRGLEIVVLVGQPFPLGHNPKIFLDIRARPVVGLL